MWGEDKFLPPFPVGWPPIMRRVCAQMLQQAGAANHTPQSLQNIRQRHQVRQRLTHQPLPTQQYDVANAALHRDIHVRAPQAHRLHRP